MPNMYFTESQPLRVVSPAKLNLFLHITGRRPDGYHTLQTIFELITLYDSIEFFWSESDAIETYGLPEVATEDNLVFRAMQALHPYRKTPTGTTIRLRKNIPTGAGLGGGSSNAATVLMILNQLWECQLSSTQLRAIGTCLGADVPIFIYGHSAWAEGIGEELTSIDLGNSRRHYLILKPDCFISTQRLFSHGALTRNQNPSKFAAYQQNPNDFGNHFEPIARSLYPAVDEAFRYLNQFGKPRLTGTGACVFVELDEQIDTLQLQHSVPFEHYVVEGLAKSPVLSIVESLQSHLSD